MGWCLPIFQLAWQRVPTFQDFFKEILYRFSIPGSHLSFYKIVATPTFPRYYVLAVSASPHACGYRPCLKLLVASIASLCAAFAHGGLAATTLSPCCLRQAVRNQLKLIPPNRVIVY